MPHERVYHPETCEPFDVPASKAADLRLNHGWSSTPWRREADPEPAVREVARGRGRRRPEPVEEAPIEHFAGPAPFVMDDEPEADADAE
jgi:hypothetical protein